MDQTKQERVLDFTYPILFAFPEQLQQPQPSQVQKVQIRAVNWAELPKVRDLRFYEVTKTRAYWSKNCLGLSLPSLVATLYTAYRFTAKPIVVIASFSGFSLLTASLFISGIVLRLISSSPLDPEYREMQRLKAKETLKNSIPAYDQINYDESVLTKEEVQALLQRDLANLGYTDFIDKHKINVLRFLDTENKKCIKPMYIENLLAEVVQGKGLKELVEREASRALGVTEKDLAARFAYIKLYTAQEKNHTYEKFITDNGMETIQYITEPSCRNWLICKFQQHVLQKMEDKSSNEAKKAFELEFQAFGNEVKEDTLRQLTYAILYKKANSFTFDYDTFFTNNDPSYLKHENFLPLQIASFLKQKYLELPYHLMKKYAIHRHLNYLDISQDEMTNALWSRWNTQSIQQICASPQEANDFFASIQDGLFKPIQWTQKVVTDTQGQSIQQIFQISTRLLTSGILTRDTALLSGHRIADQLQYEINQYKSFEQLAESYPKEIFDQKYFSFSLSHLVIDFVKRHPEQYLSGFDTDEKKYASIIEKYLLIPTNIQEAIRVTKKEINLANSNSQKALTELDRKLQNSLWDENLKEEQEIASAKYIHQIEENLSKVNKKQQKKLVFLTTIEQITNNLSLLKSSLNECRMNLALNEKELKELQLKQQETTNKVLQPEELQSLQKNYNLEKQKTADLEKTNNLCLKEDLEVIKLIKKLASSELQIQLKTLWDEEQKLAKKVEGQQEEKTRLEKEIEQTKKEKELAQGISNAINAIRKSTTEAESTLATIQEDEKKLATLRQKINDIEKNLSSDEIKATQSLKLQNLQETLQTETRQLKQKQSEIQEPLIQQQEKLQQLSLKLENNKKLLQSFQETENKVEQLNKQIQNRKKALNQNNPQSIPAKIFETTSLLNQKNTRLQVLTKLVSSLENAYSKSVTLFENTKKEINEKYLKKKQKIELSIEEERKNTKNHFDTLILRCKQEFNGFLFKQS